MPVRSSAIGRIAAWIGEQPVGINEMGTVFNAAIGGRTAANYLEQNTLDRIGVISPSLVTHMVGSNDFYSNVPAATFRQNLRVAVEKVRVKAPQAVQVLIHQQPRPGVTTGWDAWGDNLRQVADETGVFFLDLNKAFQAKANIRDYIQNDQMHLTEEGHAVLADVWGRALGLSPADQKYEVFAFTSFDGGVTSSRKRFGIMAVPARAFPRSLIITGTVYAGVETSRGQADIEVAANNVLQKHRMADGFRRNIPVHALVNVDAGVEAKIELWVNPYGSASAYVSSNREFVSVTVLAVAV